MFRLPEELNGEPESDKAFSDGSSYHCPAHQGYRSWYVRFKGKWVYVGVYDKWNDGCKAVFKMFCTLRDANE